MAVQIDEIDKKILNLLSADARTPFLEVARKCEFRERLSISV